MSWVITASPIKFDREKIPLNYIDVGDVIHVDDAWNIIGGNDGTSLVWGWNWRVQSVDDNGRSVSIVALSPRGTCDRETNTTHRICLYDENGVKTGPFTKLDTVS